MKLHFVVAIVLAIAIGATTIFAVLNATTDTTAQAEMVAPAQDTARYLPYSPEAFEQLRTQRRVLFFKADWCTSCLDANEDIEGRAAELPADVTVLKVQYDQERELKARYNITVQHTFVIVDEAGNTTKMWVGGGMKELLEYLQQS